MFTAVIIINTTTWSTRLLNEEEKIHTFFRTNLKKFIIYKNKIYLGKELYNKKWWGGLFILPLYLINYNKLKIFNSKNEALIYQKIQEKQRKRKWRLS